MTFLKLDLVLVRIAVSISRNQSGYVVCVGVTCASEVWPVYCSLRVKFKSGAADSAPQSADFLPSFCNFSK